MNGFRNRLKHLMNEFVHTTYRITKNFPREEVYTSAAQLRRAALSVILNYVEGYARRRPAVQLSFFEISYGSLKESIYLLQFVCDENYITPAQLTTTKIIADEIGAMSWSEIKTLEERIANTKNA